MKWIRVPMRTSSTCTQYAAAHVASYIDHAIPDLALFLSRPLQCVEALRLRELRAGGCLHVGSLSSSLFVLQDSLSVILLTIQVEHEDVHYSTGSSEPHAVPLRGACSCGPPAERCTARTSDCRG